MRCADHRGDRRLAAWLAGGMLAVAAALGGCGGGTTTQVTFSGPGLKPGDAPVAEAAVTTPTGSNTTEIVVDAGPATGFSLGAANIPYVTVTVCAPGSNTACATIDHVILDTGSYGLRVLKSKVATLGLPPVTLAANAALTVPTPAGTAVECYPFVVGGLWGPLARADVLIGGETASQIPVQLIDDTGTAGFGPPADCLAATNNQVLASATALQANGVLGVGMVSLDCGASCDPLPDPATGLADNRYLGSHVQYYVCPDANSANCLPAAIPSSQQLQNPVVHFASGNNNGTLISLPALPTLGAGLARGRLVFGIGTQANNQIAASAKKFAVDTDPAHYATTYLFITTTLGANSYTQSYIDSGSNGLFFDDTSISRNCQTNSGAHAGCWYCPTGTLALTATLTGYGPGQSGTADFSLASADALFTASGSNGSSTFNSLAFATLGGSVGQGAQTFVWGLPFFYGRTVYTSIWRQALSTNGPWYAF